MELKWLEDFVTLADTGSFSRAADLRHITQSAFSRRIKQLEVWLGTTLINRATIPAELTPAGMDFLPVARDSIRALYAAREELLPVSEPGMARFSALHTLTVTFFPVWRERLQAIVPDLTTSLLPDKGGIEANLSTLIDGESDFFLTYAHPDVPFHLDHRQFEYLTIGTDRLVVVAAPVVRLSAQERVAGAGLLDRGIRQRSLLPYLSYGHSSFFGVALTRLFANRPPFRRRTLHENTISAGLKTMALTGAGLCWLPESLIQTELEQGTLALASEDDAWRIDLEIRLYRHPGNHQAITQKCWGAALKICRGPEAGIAEEG